MSRSLTASRSSVRLRGGLSVSFMQLRSCAVIFEQVFGADNLGPELSGQRAGLALAMATNAMAESALDPGAIGDGGWSIGLFQCNRKGGAGRGHTEAALKDPVYNTRVILEELRRDGAPLRAAVQRGTTVGELAALFSTYIERPADKAGEAVRRRELAARMWGADVAEAPLPRSVVR